jgi:hypothetical protein
VDFLHNQMKKHVKASAWWSGGVLRVKPGAYFLTKFGTI